MITDKDRARWAKRVRYQSLVAPALGFFVLASIVTSTMKFWLFWKGWALLVPAEHTRLLGERRHTDWSSNRRGLEILVRDSFISGVKGALFALLGLFAFFLQRSRFQSDVRLWEHIELLEAEKPAASRSP